MSSAFTRNFMSLLAEREEISRGVMAGLSARMIDSAFQSTRFSVLDTTYFFAASIVRAKGFHPIGQRSPRRRPKR